MAVTLGRLAAYTTVQLKGPVVQVTAPTQDRLDAVAEHIDRFVLEAAAVGVSEAVARALVGPDLMAVTIDVQERFDETPGSGAGRPL